MASQLETDTQPGVTNLVTGIIDDARRLFNQQLTLFQVEIKNDLRRTINVTVTMIAGISVCFVGAIVLAMALAYLICWAWQDLPLWGGFGLVGLALALGGAGLLLWGKAKFDSFSLLPEESVEGLKENIQWKTKK